MQEQIKQKEENQDYVEWQSSSLQLIDSITEITEKFVDYVSKKKQQDNLQTIQESPHETLSESQIVQLDTQDGVDSPSHLKRLSYENEMATRSNKHQRESNSNKSSEEDFDTLTDKTSKTLLEFAPKQSNKNIESQQILSSKVIELMNIKLSNNTISDKKVLHFEKRIKSAQNLESSKDNEIYTEQDDAEEDNDGDKSDSENVISLLSFDETKKSATKDVEDAKLSSDITSNEKSSERKNKKIKVRDELNGEVQSEKKKKNKLNIPKKQGYLSKSKGKLRQSQSMKILDGNDDDQKTGKEEFKSGYELQMIDEMKESIEKLYKNKSPVKDSQNLIQLNKAVVETESTQIIADQENLSQKALTNNNLPSKLSLEKEVSIFKMNTADQDNSSTKVTVDQDNSSTNQYNSSEYKKQDDDILTSQMISQKHESESTEKRESNSLQMNNAESLDYSFNQLENTNDTNNYKNGENKLKQKPQINILKVDTKNKSQKNTEDDQEGEDSIKLVQKDHNVSKNVEVNSLELYFIILGDFISFKITDITFLCVKDVTQFIKTKPQYIQFLQQEIITIVDRLDDFFSQIPQNIAESKKIIEYGIPETLNLLKEILSIDKIPKKKEHEQMIATSMALLYKIMIFPNMVEQTFNNVLYQVQYSDDIIYQLLNEIVTNFKTKRTLYKSIFICFIKEFFQEDVSDVFFDRTLKKILQIIKTLIDNEAKVNKKYIYDILLHLYKLINLKYDSSYHHFWYTQLNAQNNPIWYEATQNFAHIANILITNKIQVDPILQLTLDFFKQEIKEQDKIQFKNDEDLMLYLDHDKTMLLFLLKSFALGEVQLTQDQGLEIGQLIHTFSQRKPNLQIEKLHLLEKYQAQSFSQFCLEALFQISNFIEGCSEQRHFNSQLFLPFFLSRAQAIFDKFISTIEQSNQKPNTIKEVQSRQFLHFLENLQNLNIPPNTFKEFKSNKVYSSLPYRLKKIDNPLLNNSKGHIGYLMPQLTECIHSNQLEVREFVKLIINTYHQKIGVYDLQ